MKVKFNDFFLDRLHRNYWFLVLIFFCSACVPQDWRIRDQDPFSAEEHFNLGMTYAKGGKLDLAIQEYQAAYKNEPQNPEYGLTLGNAYSAMGQIEKAENIFKKLIRRHNHLGAKNNLAMLYLHQKKKIEKAEILALEVAQSDSPYRVFALETLADIYLLQGKKSEALETIDKAMAMLSDKDESLYRILSQKKNLIIEAD